MDKFSYSLYTYSVTGEIQLLHGFAGCDCICQVYGSIVFNAIPRYIQSPNVCILLKVKTVKID